MERDRNTKAFGSSMGRNKVEVEAGEKDLRPFSPANNNSLGSPYGLPKEFPWAARNDEGVMRQPQYFFIEAFLKALKESMLFEL